jgi:hypothetical protein
MKCILRGFSCQAQPRYRERLFPRPRRALSSSHTTADRVRLLTRMLRLWITVPENFHGPEIHRAFRLLNGGFRTFYHTVHEWLGVKIRLLVPISFLGWLCKAF